MDTELDKLLLEWPLSVIRDVDISAGMSGSSSRRYALLNRALKKNVLIKMSRGRKL